MSNESHAWVFRDGRVVKRYDCRMERCTMCILEGTLWKTGVSKPHQHLCTACFPAHTCPGWTQHTGCFAISFSIRTFLDLKPNSWLFVRELLAIGRSLARLTG